MEIELIFNVFIGICLLLVSILYYRSANRVDGLIRMVTDMQRIANDSVETALETQKHFRKIIKTMDHDALKFYTQGGHWHHEADQLDMAYHCHLREDRSPEILIGLKKWSAKECREKGTIFWAASVDPQEAMKTFSQMMVSDALAYHKNGIKSNEHKTSITKIQ